MVYRLDTIPQPASSSSILAGLCGQSGPLARSIINTEVVSGGGRVGWGVGAPRRARAPRGASSTGCARIGFIASRVTSILSQGGAQHSEPCSIMVHAHCPGLDLNTHTHTHPLPSTEP